MPGHQQDAVALYHRFLNALNTTDYEKIAEVISSTFEDHHPGFEIHGLQSYLAALREAYDALELRADPEEILAVGDRVITRARLTGKHVGTVMNMRPTGKRLTWTTMEIWRAADGRLVERWAIDDLLGLREQLSTVDDNIRLVRHIGEAVNERRYDDIDEFFSESFIDRNPAWTVKNLNSLKRIIQAAHDALDFTIHLEDIYAADDDKVVAHIRLTGRHVAPFFGMQPTGKHVEWTSIEVYRIENLKVVERWVQADIVGLMRQLDVPLPLEA